MSLKKRSLGKIPKILLFAVFFITLYSALRGNSLLYIIAVLVYGLLIFLGLWLDHKRLKRKSRLASRIFFFSLCGIILILVIGSSAYFIKSFTGIELPLWPDVNIQVIDVQSTNTLLGVEYERSDDDDWMFLLIKLSMTSENNAFNINPHFSFFSIYSPKRVLLDYSSVDIWHYTSQTPFIPNHCISNVMIPANQTIICNIAMTVPRSSNSGILEYDDGRSYVDWVPINY